MDVIYVMVASKRTDIVSFVFCIGLQNFEGRRTFHFSDIFTASFQEAFPCQVTI